MAELPKLPERILRLHSLRWNELIEKHGFTGDHLKWHESRVRRRTAARPRFSLAPPPLVTEGTRSETTLYGTDRQPVPHEKWLEQQMEAWVRRESDHDIIDSIGIAETITLAKARFSEVIIDYLNFWSASTDHNSDEFRHLSIGIAQSVGREIGDLWRKDQWHTRWFERACHKKIDEALLPLTREWECRASKLEIQGLENPHLSIESLLVAKGNLSVASTLEKSKRTMETAQQFLSSLHATEHRFALDQKIRSDIHDVFMSTVGRLQEEQADSGVPASINVPAKEVGITRKRDNPTRPSSRFPTRASWLRGRLLERGWSNADPSEYGGPDRKTIEKILRGEAVRNDVLEKLAYALAKKHAKLSVVDVPQD